MRGWSRSLWCRSVSCLVSAALVLVGMPVAAYATNSPPTATPDDLFHATGQLLAGNDSDYFGCAASVEGTRAVIGAYGDAISRGAAYVFERDGMGRLGEVAKLTADDAGTYDYFGYSVAVSGDTILVGAYGDNDPSTDSGSAYVFERQQDGTWEQTAKLLASDAAASDCFGFSVALSGGLALVGAPNRDDPGSNSGGVYAFVRNTDGTWSQETRISPSDLADGDSFGYSVALSGSRAAIGSRCDDDRGSNSGSAYVYTRSSGGTWGPASQARRA